MMAESMPPAAGLSLRQLFEGLPEAPLEQLDGLDEGIRVGGLCHDSRRIRTGDLFVAIVGSSFDGRAYAAKAVEAGAVAVLGPLPEADGRGRSAGPGPLWPGPVPWLEVADPRPLMGPLAANLHGRPHEKTTLVGFTGTNGKSTCVDLMASVLGAAGLPAARLGTLGYFFGDREWEAGGRTTPEATDLHRMLVEMAAEGARSVAMEVSSIGLDMGRTEGTTFDVAVFTNLTRDHLDYHHTMESYFAAKRRFFDQLKPAGRAVVHLGDPWGRRLATQLPEALTFGEHLGDVHVIEAELGLEGIRARFRTPRGELRVRSSLLGHYNLENLLATAAAAEALELRPEAIERGLEEASIVPGRLQPVAPSHGSAPFPALVDYAHTPDALEAALRSVRRLSDRRMAVVFGCGGERDRGKRPMMGEIAGRLADFAVLTSDNPRREDPAAILAEVEAGLEQGLRAATSEASDSATSRKEHRVEGDRRRAIRLAVEHAASGEEKGESWLVVVAGKGHETTQDLGGEIIDFDDRTELVAALDRITGKAGIDGGWEEAHG